MIEIHFKDRPTRATINHLKNKGMRWDASRKCWVCENNYGRLTIVKRFTMEDIKKSLERYRDFKIPTGSFLHAVLTNDLYAAVVRADFINIQRIPEIVKMVDDMLQPNQWGSVEIVNQHLKKRGKDVIL